MTIITICPPVNFLVYDVCIYAISCQLDLGMVCARPTTTIAYAWDEGFVWVQGSAGLIQQIRAAEERERPPPPPPGNYLFVGFYLRRQRFFGESLIWLMARQDYPSVKYSILIFHKADFFRLLCCSLLVFGCKQKQLRQIFATDQFI